MLERLLWNEESDSTSSDPVQWNQTLDVIGSGTTRTAPRSDGIVESKNQKT